VIAYRATLDVPRELVQFVAKLLRDERRQRGTPKGSRALTCFWEAGLALRWFRDRTSPDALARDHGVSRATAYRYLDEVIEVLASQAADLHQALERARNRGFSHVILDGKIIPCNRCKEPVISVKGEVIDLWYSGKAAARRTPTAATSKPSPPRTGSRRGSRRRSPARCTTSPLPALTPCPGSTGPLTARPSPNYPIERGSRRRLTAPRAGASARPLPWEARPSRAGPTARAPLINSAHPARPRAGAHDRLPRRSIVPLAATASMALPAVASHAIAIADH
jgi:hypothetical protein